MVARYVCPTTCTKRGRQCIKREKLTYDILKSIISLAAEGLDWLQHVFIHEDESLTFLIRCSALSVLALTIVTLVIRNILKQTESADVSFNFGLVQDYGSKESDITEGKIRHISEHAAKLELLKSDPIITTASGITVKRPESLDEACTMIGGLYDCISRISKFASLSADRLHIIERHLKAVLQYALVAEHDFWRPYRLNAYGPHQQGKKYREAPSTFDQMTQDDDIQGEKETPIKKRSKLLRAQAPCQVSTP